MNRVKYLYFFIEKRNDLVFFNLKIELKKKERSNSHGSNALKIKLVDIKL